MKLMTESIYIGHDMKRFNEIRDCLLYTSIIVNFGPAILYLVGARRNRPAGEQIEVESR